ncbi:MAG: hypothetical protein O9254_01500 [Rhodobacteraceae bacterium]|nr:hypothetical protein [Paracoccaceae bacterium]
MKLRTASIAFVLSVLPAIGFAEKTLTLDLPKGDVEVGHDASSFQAVISFGGQTIRMESGYLPSLQRTWGDSAMIFMPTGGSGCPGLFAWVTVDAHGLRATEPFGTCSDLVTFEDRQDGILAAIPRLDGSGTSSFVFDGQSVLEEELGLSSAGVGEPSSAKAWAGRMAGELMSRAEMEPVLLEILDWETLELARQTIVISSEVMEQDGDWYAATGCMPHNCDAMRGGVAISVSDGTVIVALWNRETGGELFGQPKSALPDRLRAVLSGR